MKIIIFAGGTGKRFWPASRKKAPKQFLPIIDNKPLLRHRYDILRQGFKNTDIFVSTGEMYKKEVKEILPELPAENLILEPEMRDTGPAVSLAINYLDSFYPNEIISIQWSDHLIKKPEIFIATLKEAEKLMGQNNKTTLIAVPARFPSPHRGYINFGKKEKELAKEIDLYEFIKFVEKPSKETAAKYIAEGSYGWNPGYFNLTANQFNSKLKEFKPDMYSIIMEIREQNFSLQALEKFKELEKISFDYIFAEHLKRDEAQVILTEINWSDVGEWIAFKEALEESNSANVVNGRSFDMDSKDTLIFNTEADKLIATIGLNGMIVVNTPDVLAVFHKDDNSKIKEFIKKMEENGLENYL